MPTHFAGLFLLFSFLAAPSAWCSSLEELERIAARAKTFDEFVAHHEWVDEYFNALQAYFGKDRITRIDFNTVLTQLEELAKNVPEVKTRVWEEIHGGKAFSIESKIQSHGRLLDSHKWSSYFWELQNKLTQTSGELSNLKGADRDKRIAELTDRL